MTPTSGKPPLEGGASPLAPLSPLIHGRVRLLILCHLMTHAESATFTELRAALGLTDGTLSVHLSRLAEGGVVAIEKRFVGKRPQTVVKVTVAGRRSFRQYVQELRNLVPGLAG